MFWETEIQGCAVFELGGRGVGQLEGEKGEGFVGVEAGEERHPHLLAVGESGPRNEGKDVPVHAGGERDYRWICCLGPGGGCDERLR